MRLGESTAGECKLSRLARLRWLLLIVLGLTWLTAESLLRIHLPFHLMFTGVSLMFLSNLFLARMTAVSRFKSGALILSFLLLDVGVLTGLLFFAGGSHNPFSTFYLLLVAVAAVLTPGAGIWWVALLSAGGFGLQFFSPFELACHTTEVFDISFDLHLQGMFVAQSLCGLFLAWFVSSLGRGLRKLEAELACERSLAEKRRQLTAIATLAAGVAHEIGTPLSTISLAGEALIARYPDSEDAALIQHEVARCRSILGRINLGALRADIQADLQGPVDLATVPERVVSGLTAADIVRVRFEGFAESGRAACSKDLLVQSLLALLTNALSSTADGVIEAHCKRKDGIVQISVLDRGMGLPPEVSDRFAEPFRSGRVDGRGLGLGLFLVRMFVASLDGSLTIKPREGGGTCVSLGIPAAP